MGTTEEPAADEELAGPLRVDEASEECDHTIAREFSRCRQAQLIQMPLLLDV